MDIRYIHPVVFCQGMPSRLWLGVLCNEPSDQQSTRTRLSWVLLKSSLSLLVHI